MPLRVRPRGTWVKQMEPEEMSDTPRSARRACLVTLANPAPWHDTLVRWTGTLAGELAGELAGDCRLRLDYVPDRTVLTPESMSRYLAALEATPWTTLEALVAVILDDVNNQLVPRWVLVTATRQTDMTAHHAAACDGQPDWDRPALLDRLEAALARA